MQRYNIYKHVNKGIRALLFETSLQIQQCDFVDKAQGNEVLQKVKDALLVIERCNNLQSQYIFTLTRQYQSALTSTLEKENERITRFMTEIKEQCAAWSTASGADDAIERGRNLLNTFNRFVLFNLEHLPRKEESMNHVLCTEFTDREIFRLKRMIVGQMQQQEILALGKWIVRGVNNTELTDWLKEMQKYVSTEIFRSLCFIVERELPLTRFIAVTDALAEGSLLS